MRPLVWTQAASDADLAGYERVDFDWLRQHVVRRAEQQSGIRKSLANPAQAWLDRVAGLDALAVVGVRLRSLEDLKALHGYVLEPAWRAGVKVLIAADRKLSELEPSRFTDDGFEYAYTLERALHAAHRIWRPEPPPAPSDVPLTLDAEQVRAVRTPGGTVQIIAPAGSGKTTVLIERIRELLRRGVAGERILATTFNHAAGLELTGRLAAAGVHGVEARTFHSLGLWILRDEGVINPRARVRQLSLGQWRRLCALASRDTGTWINVRDARAAIGDAKLGLLATPAEFAARAGERPDGATLARIYELYAEQQAQQGTIDYDDMVMLAVRALRSDGELRRRWQDRFSYVLVDEYQDIEPAQELLVRILAAPGDELFCVGDDDQTLYGFRRASVRRMIDLDLAYPGLTRVSLGHNYRCPPRIVGASRALIDHNDVRFAKTIEPAPGAADPADAIELHEPDTQAQGAARIATVLAAHKRGQIVVLARTTNLLRAVALACAAEGVRISAPPTIFDPEGARAAVEAHLRLCHAPADARAEDVAAVCRAPSRGLPYEAEEHAAELLRGGLTFTQAFAALPANDTQRAKLDQAGRTLDALAQLENARSFIHYLRHRGGLEAHFAERDEAFGDVEQIEVEALEQAEAEAEGLTVVAYLTLLAQRTDALRAIRDDEQGIEVTTIHRAKGRQWPRVELFACEEGQLPHARAVEVTAAQEAAGEGEQAERRLAYVAFTRAQRTLAITAMTSAASRFLTEAGLNPAHPYRPPPPPEPVPPPRRTSRARVAGPGEHPDPLVARALGEAHRVGLSYALRTAPDRTTALTTAATAIERKLFGAATTSERMTVAKLFAAIETLSDSEREQAIRAAGARETAILARLDSRMHKRIVHELEALARGRPSA